MHTFLLISIILIAEYGYSQTNLVVNPSFEDTAQMTQGWPYLITANWWNPNGYTTDYFTSHCNDLLNIGSGGIYCAPQSDLGYQMAQHGSSYLGLVVYESNGSEGKDYARGQLSEPLQQGELYCIGLWMCLLDSSGLKSCDFQVSFTNDPIENGSALNLMLPHSVEFDISGLDTLSWTYFESVYAALGGEQYIYLGSNTPNEELTCIEQASDSWLWNTSYVLVDNVSVIQTKQCEVDNEEIPTMQDFIIYPNPAREMLHIRSGIEGSWNLKIFNSFGSLIRNDVCQGQNQKIDISSLPSSMYFFEISGENVVFRTRITKE